MMMSFGKRNNGEKKYYFDEKTRERLKKNGRYCFIFSSFCIAISALLRLMISI